MLAFGAERYGLLGPTEPDEPGRAATDGPAGGARALASLLPAPSALGDPAATPKDVRDLRKAPSTGGGSSPTAASPDPAEALSAADEAGRPGELVAVHGAFPGGIVDGYSLYLPRSYGDGDTTYPTIVFLTGGCGVGGDVGDLACWGLPKRIAERVDEEDDDLLSRYDRLLLDTFIVIAPHMTGGSYEERQFYDQEEAIARILDRVAAEHRVDEERVYLTGAGRGGHGTWGLASRMPDRFAAIAPIRGFLDGVVDWDALAELPIWTAHRVEDDQVPYAESAAAVTRLEDAGGEAFLRLDALDASDADLDGTSRVFTTIATDEGGSWPNLYERPEFFDWLLRFRRPAASGEEPREL